MSNERTGVLELTLGDSYIGSAYSPQVEVTDTATGHEVAITYMSPSGLVTERFDVADGERGPQGPAGFSPTVTITDTPTGHTVTITDEDGPHSYDVPNYAQEEQQRQDAWDELSGEVTDAITAAESATSAASTAAQSATSAASSANTAAQSATTAAASANTAASAATSAATAANSAATAAGTAADAATTAASSATDAASAANTAAQAAQEAATEVAPEVAWLWGNQLTKQVEGELLTAADAYAAPPTALVVDGRSTQDGTPTPDAPVPIESVDELTIHANDTRGATWWNQLSDNSLTSLTRNGITFTNNGDGSITANGTATAAVTFNSVEHAGITAQQNHVYLLRGCPTGGSISAYCLQDPFMNQSPYIDFGNGRIFTNTSTSTRLLTQIYIANGATVENLVFRPQLFDLTAMFGAGNEPSTVEEFTAMFPEPYYPYDAGSWLDSGDWPVSIPLQDHVLRSLPDGTKDTLALTYLRPSTREGWAWYSRELVERVVHHIYDGSEPWNYEITARRFRNFYRTKPSNTNNGTYGAYVQCSHGIANNGPLYAIPNGAYVSDSGNTNLCFGDALDMSSAEDFATWLSENPVTFDCLAATPITTTLDPIELPVLPAPTCTVWADPTTGLQMEYVRDTNLVVSSLSAETAIAYASIATVDGPTATASHAVGTYLTMGGTLYKVTQAIAVGETIAAGTNVTATTVMAELIARTA